MTLLFPNFPRQGHGWCNDKRERADKATKTGARTVSVIVMVETATQNVKQKRSVLGKQQQATASPSSTSHIPSEHHGSRCSFVPDMGWSQVLLILRSAGDDNT